MDQKELHVHFVIKVIHLKDYNMSFDTFKILLDKLPKTLGQIAFGCDATTESNPDVWKIICMKLIK